MNLTSFGNKLRFRFANCRSWLGRLGGALRILDIEVRTGKVVRTQDSLNEGTDRFWRGGGGAGPAQRLRDRAPLGARHLAGDPPVCEEAEGRPGQTAAGSHAMAHPRLHALPGHVRHPLRGLHAPQEVLRRRVRPAHGVGPVRRAQHARAAGRGDRGQGQRLRRAAELCALRPPLRRQELQL